MTVPFAFMCRLMLAMSPVIPICALSVSWTPPVTPPNGTSTPLFVNGLQYDFIYCVKAVITIGSPAGEESRSINEAIQEIPPPPRVPLDDTVPGFWIGKTEMTQQIWVAVMGSNPSRKTNPQNPVENVSWNDCKAFIDTVRSASPTTYIRLPLEVEWEYACRAGTTTPWAATDLSLIAVDFKPGTYGLPNGADFGPLQVATKDPNAWGIYDMHGNVAEWCSEWYAQDYRYVKATTGNPHGDASPTAPAVALKSVRGGSRIGGPWFARSAYRLGEPIDQKLHYLGFRPVIMEVIP